MVCHAVVQEVGVERQARVVVDTGTEELGEVEEAQGDQIPAEWMEGVGSKTSDDPYSRQDSEQAALECNL